MRKSRICFLVLFALSLSACASNNKPTNIGIGAITGTLAGAPTGNPMIMAGGAIIGAAAGYAMPSKDQHEYNEH